MCQCLICQCWWCHWCDPCCIGCGQFCFCFGCWMCKSDQVKAFNDQCCTCCQFVGFGSVSCCVGNICCAPEYVKAYSVKKSTHRTAYQK